MAQAPPAPLFELWPIQQELFGMFGLDPENPVDEPAEEVLFGGMAGGSKSFTGRALCLFLALEYWPGSRGFICRQTFPEVYSTHVIPLLQTLPPHVGKYNATTHQYIFHNGSILDFIHCAEDADAFKYLSYEYDYGFFDESTQLSALQYTLLRSRIRSSREDWRRIVLACSNPGGQSHTYFKEKFVDAAPARAIFMSSDGWRRAFLPSRLQDNPSLSQEAVKASLMAISDPMIRKAHADGNWNIGADQVFSEWSPELHVCEPFFVDPEWPRFGGHDYGFAAPACHLWLAKIPPNTPIPVQNPHLRVSERTRVLVYRELYRTQLTAQMQALAIRNASAGERIGVRYADPSMWGRARELGSSFAMEFAACGVRLTPGNNNRMKGVERVHHALMDHDLWPPELLIMSTCTNLIRTLPSLPRDKHNQEDVDTDAEDH